MSAFTIDASCDQRVLTLVLAGELDAGSAGVLAEAVAAHRAAGASCVVLELADLEFIDSSGIATVVKAAQQLTGEGGHLELRRPARPVRRAFEMCGLLHLLELDVATSMD
jgi:anti-sigma B factor antagonist